MCDMAQTLVERQGLRLDEVAGLGVGVPGPMHHTEDGKGYLVNPTALPGLAEHPARELAARPARHARLSREQRARPRPWASGGTARAVRSGTFFYIYFGSGLGGGLVMNGQPYEGFTGNAGEIGYLPTILARDVGDRRRGRTCRTSGCTSTCRASTRGCASRGATRARSRISIGCSPRSNPALLEWMDDASDHLTGLVLAIEYVLDPEAICFGGRLSDRVVGGLMERVARQLPERRIAGKSSGPKHFLATAGVDAGALGVATLPIYSIFAPEHSRAAEAATRAGGRSARRRAAHASR